MSACPRTERHEGSAYRRSDHEGRKSRSYASEYANARARACDLVNFGATLVGNRKTGDGFSVTYWESERAMQNARPQVRPQAEKILNSTGGKIVDEDECELAVRERIQPAKAGTFVRVTTVEADPAKAGDGIAHYKEKIVPVIRAQAGARTALLFVNRKSGRTFSATGWDTEQDLQKSEPAVTALRDEVIKMIGGKSSKVEAFEVYVTEILTPAPVAS